MDGMIKEMRAALTNLRKEIKDGDWFAAFKTSNAISAISKRMEEFVSLNGHKDIRSGQIKALQGGTVFKVKNKGEFVYDLYNGVAFCARKYNVSENEIRNEAKRLAPEMILRN